MTVFKWEPYSAGSLRHELDTLFDRILGVEPAKAQTDAYVMKPAADIYESDKELTICIEVPGVKKENLEIKAEAGVLRVRGEKRAVRQPEGASRHFHIAERSWGTYERALSLPDYLEPDKAMADYTDGVLTVVIPKREEAKEKEIKIAVK